MKDDAPASVWCRIDGLVWFDSSHHSREEGIRNHRSRGATGLQR